MTLSRPQQQQQQREEPPLAAHDTLPPLQLNSPLGRYPRHLQLQQHLQQLHPRRWRRYSLEAMVATRASACGSPHAAALKTTSCCCCCAAFEMVGSSHAPHHHY